MIKIIIKKSGERVAEKALGEFALNIGSKEGSEIRLAPEDASPEHAVISLLGERILVEDLGGKNGTFLKGEKISSEFIEPGDSLRIGSYTLEVAREDPKQKPLPERSEDIELKKRKRIEEALKPASDWPSLTSYKTETDIGRVPRPSEEKTELEINAPDGKSSKSMKPKNAEEIKESGSKPLQTKCDEENTGPPGKKPEDLDPSDKTVAIPSRFEPRLYGIKDKKYYPLVKDANTVGRNEDSEIVLRDKSISQEHAKITKRGANLVVIDLQSTNGTRVNGENIEEKSLKCHDLVEFGDLKFEFLEGAVEPLGEGFKFELLSDTKPKMLKYTPPGEKRARDAVKKFSQTKRGRLYIFAVLMGLAAIAVIFFFKKPKEVPTEPGQILEQYGKEESEKERIILHNLERAKEYAAKKDYEEAKNILNLILEKIDRDNLEAKRMLAGIDAAERDEKERLAEEQRSKNEKEDRIAYLTAQGKKMLSVNNIQGARNTFEQILSLDPSNDTALRYIERIKVIEERMTKERKILKEKLKDIEAYYYQGISYYEEGNYDEAADALRKVVEYRSTNFYQSATKILSEIQKKQMMNIESQLTEIDTLLKNEELVKAENILKSILRHFPENAKAKSMYSKVHGRIAEKAQKIFQEGIVYENVVEDIRSAVESYEEVLKLLPDPNEEYHEKAKERLKKLK